jgi:cobalt-zinc-cadmium efflux system protein
VPALEHGETEAEELVLSGIRWAFVVTAVVLVLEVAGAFLSRSLSLTVDAVHNAPDLLAFAVSWFALRATERGANDRFTFGVHRFEVFAGLLNAALVLGTGAAFGYEALATMVHGSTFAGPVDAVWVLIVALPTLGLRTANLALLGRIPRRARDLNLRSVVIHLASDVLITGALLVAAALLLLHPAWTDADAGGALVIAAILVYESLPLFRDGADVLTERTPRNLSVEAIEGAARRVPHVAQLHDLHVWAVCPTLVCMSAHVQVDEISVRDSMQVVAELRAKMADEFGILHSVFEVEVGSPTPAPAHGASARPGAA